MEIKGKGIAKVFSTREQLNISIPFPKCNGEREENLKRKIKFLHPLNAEPGDRNPAKLRH